jgi:hypothetical protein
MKIAWHNPGRISDLMMIVSFSIWLLYQGVRHSLSRVVFQKSKSTLPPGTVPVHTGRHVLLLIDAIENLNSQFVADEVDTDTYVRQRNT